MCLYPDAAYTAKLAERIEKTTHRKILAWKVVDCYPDGSLRSHYYNETRWDAGWQRSTSRRRWTGRLRRARHAINRGIHVYLSRHRASLLARRFGTSTRVLPVWCHLDDLIAAEVGWDEAVFRKVYATEHAIAKAKRPA